MIDIHCHLLPGLDDGAETVEEALEIALQLSQAGFRKVIATPHVFEERNSIKPEEIIQVTRSLNVKINETGIKIEVFPGAENYMSPDLALGFKEGRYLSLANTGRYILLELPMQEIPIYTDHVFFELQLMRVTPVLAHPERNLACQEDPQKLLDWVRKGILLQLDLHSLGGKYGLKVQRFAQKLLKEGLYTLIGSDAHRKSKSVWDYQRELQIAQEQVEEKEWIKLIDYNPEAIISRKYGLDIFSPTFEVATGFERSPLEIGHELWENVKVLWKKCRTK